MRTEIKVNYSDTATNFTLSIPKLTEDNKENIRYFAEQRIIGIACIVLGIAAPIFLDGEDAIASLLLVPAGLYFLFTGKKVL